MAIHCPSELQAIARPPQGFRHAARTLPSASHTATLASPLAATAVPSRFQATPRKRSFSCRTTRGFPPSRAQSRTVRSVPAEASRRPSGLQAIELILLRGSRVSTCHRLMPGKAAGRGTIPGNTLPTGPGFHTSGAG